MKLTRSEEKIYILIDNFIKENKYSPSIRELCDMLGGRSTATVQKHLVNMKLKGFINYQEKQSRTITLI